MGNGLGMDSGSFCDVTLFCRAAPLVKFCICVTSRGNLAKQQEAVEAEVLDGQPLQNVCSRFQLRTALLSVCIVVSQVPVLAARTAKSTRGVSCCALASLADIAL